MTTGRINQVSIVLVGCTNVPAFLQHKKQSAEHEITTDPRFDDLIKQIVFGGFFLLKRIDFYVHRLNIIAISR